VLSTVLGKDEAAINRIVADKRPVDAETALLLESVFGVGADVFLGLQKTYDLAMARMVSRGTDPGLARRAELFERLPVVEMIKRRWIDVADVRDPRIEDALAKFFGVTTPDEIEVLPHAAKKTDVFGKVTPAQLAWLYRVRQIAEEMLVPRYSASGLRSLIPELRRSLSAAENARHVPRLLAECGVRFAIVESIGNAKIDGVTFWVKDGTAPVVALSFRYDRIDNFWFVLRHEIEHVLQGHGRAAAMVDAELEGEKAGSGPGLPEEERIANETAAEFCVPRDKLKKFVLVKAPFFAERDMLGFARTIRVHPGIVAGQIRHATGRYDLFSKHLTKMRSVVAPSSTVDGWGDVVPLQQNRSLDVQ
jgi:HTH-type transcriptional regulator / antitoxin HigA